MFLSRFIKAAAVLSVATLLCGPGFAQGLKANDNAPALGFKNSTSYTEITCNPSTLAPPFTCKCDTSGGCTLLKILCKPVDGPYYTCDEDQSTSDAARVRRMIKSN